MIKLEHEPNMLVAPTRQLRFVHGRYASVADPDLAFAGSVQSGDQIEQRCFAGTARSHQSQELALWHIEVQIV